MRQSYELHVESHGVREGDLLGAGGRFGVLLPQRQEQCLDTLPFLDVEHLVVRVERVERYRRLVGIGEINPVLACGLAADHLAQPLIGVTRVDQHDVRPLLVVLPREVVREERLARTARSKYELVTVGDYAFLHRKV